MCVCGDGWVGWEFMWIWDTPVYALELPKFSVKSCHFPFHFAFSRTVVFLSHLCWGKQYSCKCNFDKKRLFLKQGECRIISLLHGFIFHMSIIFSWAAGSCSHKLFFFFSAWASLCRSLTHALSLLSLNTRFPDFLGSSSNPLVPEAAAAGHWNP